MSAPDPMRNEGVAVERSDVPPRLAATLAAGLAACVVVAAIAIAITYPEALRLPSDAPRSSAVAPRLQTNPAADMAAYRVAEARELTSTGWIDKQRGILRIPIAQAMRDVAADGIKDWPEDAR